MHLVEVLRNQKLAGLICSVADTGKVKDQRMEA